MTNTGKILAAVIVIVLLFTAYKLLKPAPSVAPSAKQPELPVVTIAASAPAVPHLLTKIAIEQGFDKALGFKFDIKPVDPTLTVSALENGSVDVAVVGVVPTALINQDGTKIQLIGPALKLTCPFVVPDSSKAQKWQDLKGQRLGTPIKSGATYLALNVLMKKQNVDLEKYFKINEGQFFALPSLLQNGSIDAFTGVCDEISNGKWMTAGKTKPLGTIEDLANSGYGDRSGLILSAFGVKKSWLDSHRSLAAKVMSAMSQSGAYIQSHPEIYDSAAIKTEYKIADTDVPQIKKFIQNYHNYEFAPWSDSVKGLKAMLDDAQKFGIIKNKPADDMFVSP